MRQDIIAACLSSNYLVPMASGVNNLPITFYHCCLRAVHNTTIYAQSYWQEFRFELKESKYSKNMTAVHSYDSSERIGGVQLEKVREATRFVGHNVVLNGPNEVRF